MISIIEKPKELRYVTVYNKLFKLINEGTFPINYKLPSEPHLAKDLGVSRTTLRQALALLQDDGLIQNIRGKGNFIIKSSTEKSIGLEKTGHIIHKSLQSNIDFIEMNFHMEPTSDYFSKILGKKTVATLSVDRWYKSNETTMAYTYTIIPIEAIALFNINLNNKDDLLKFIENEIYIKCTTTSLNIKISSSGTFATKKYSIPEHFQCYLIEESIYTNTKYPIAFNKHYLPLSNTSINIHTTKK